MNLLNLRDIPYRKVGIGAICKNLPQVTASRKSSHSGLLCLDKAGERLLAKFVNQMVASSFDLQAETLFVLTRQNSRVTRARQVSIYLMHTALSFPLSKIASIYKKDRTTVGYACRVIEDLRDKPSFDDRIVELENTIDTVLALAAYMPEQGG